METVCGVDGCSGGWFAVAKDLASGAISWSIDPGADSLFARHEAAQVIAIDLPIGLPERGPRLCDLKARQLLGAERGAAVYAAPTRHALADENPTEAPEAPSRPERKKLSWHGLRVLRRVSQVDAILRKVPALQRKVREIHPEVSFFFLGGGRPMRHDKDTEEGSLERAALLGPAYGGAVEHLLAARHYLPLSVDDVLDAFAALWTAERIHHAAHLTIPPAPPLDTAGLPMEIVA